jgi:hypothetical protein
MVHAQALVHAPERLPLVKCATLQGLEDGSKDGFLVGLMSCGMAACGMGDVEGRCCSALLASVSAVQLPMPWQ